MAYKKPGVEVTQSRDSFSPNLVAPTLVPVIVGTGYHVEDIKPSSSSFMSTYSDIVNPDVVDSTTIVSYSGLDDDWTVDTQSVYVDITISGGANSQQVLHLYNDHASLAAITTSSVTIASGLASKWTNATIQVGYRASRDDINTLTAIESTTDITDNIGEISILNPLALGTFIAKENAGTAVVSYYGVSGLAADLENEVTAHSSARDDLELEEVYAMAPMVHNETIQLSYTAHANSMSLPANKKERINIVNPPIPWRSADDGTLLDHTSVGSNKVTTAAQTRAAAFSTAETRAIYTFPDVLYAKVVNQHISTLHPDSIKNVIWGAIDPNLPAIFAEDFIVEDTAVSQATVESKYLTNLTGPTANLPTQIRWPIGVELTAARHALIASSVVKDDGYVTAYVPVPGYYVPAAIAGRVAGLAPQQGLTNLSLNVVDGLKYSGEWFTETQLNTIADGGNFIVTQDTKNTPPYFVRHQLTTNRDSVETQELSIVKTIDYVAKFVRNQLARTVGRNNITPRFLKELRMTLGALNQSLIEKGIVEDIAVTTLKQHATQRDRVVITLATLVFYPANYIDVTIVY